MDKLFLKDLFDRVKSVQPTENELIDYAVENSSYGRDNIIDLFNKTYSALHLKNVIDDADYMSLKNKILSQEDLFFDVIFDQLTEYLIYHPLKFRIQERINELQEMIDAFDESILEDDVPQPTPEELQDEINELKKLL